MLKNYSAINLNLDFYSVSQNVSRNNEIGMRNAEVGMAGSRKWEWQEVGSGNGRKSEVGMRKWENGRKKEKGQRSKVKAKKL